MKIYSYLYLLIVGLLISSCSESGRSCVDMPIKDIPYQSAYSVKYMLNTKWADTQFSKIVIDCDNNVFVLTDKGVFRDFPGHILSKDLMYRSLADKMALDICVQEGSGYLYYLYADRFLTNRHAGSICGHITPDIYSRLAVNANDDVLLIGESKAALYNKNSKIADLLVPDGKFLKLYVSENLFWYLTTDALFRLEDNNWKKIYEGKGLGALAFYGEKIAVGTESGYFVMDANGKIVQEVDTHLPVLNITGMQTVGDSLWFTSSKGAFTKCQEGYRYFASQRWLDNDSIIDLATDRNGNLYFLTTTALSKIDFREETMAGKATYLAENLRKYHLRYGFSAESRLADPNDPTTIQLNDDDNDGLWTSFYIGSQAFRYAVTGEEEARRYVWESFEPYERLLTIHPIKGFSGRTFERTGYIAGDTIPWRPSPDQDWWWKGTTSTDEFVGYMFVTSVIDMFIAQNEQEKKRVADYMDAIMTHIITNNYYFIDYDGKPTLWGRWNPEYVNSFATTQFDRRLNSMLTIAGLQLAYKLTNKDIYKTEAFRMMEESGYLDNMKIPMKNIRYTEGFQHNGITMGTDWNHSDDEMAFLTYWVLYHYALNDSLKKEYSIMINDHWDIEKPERNALWNLLAYGTSGDIDLASTIWYLREFPTDLRRYLVHNSDRKDLTYILADPIKNLRAQTITELIPKSERVMNRHNSNEFAIDGGDGANYCLAGDEYLLPYWLARYLKVIE